MCQRNVPPATKHIVTMEGGLHLEHESPGGHYHQAKYNYGHAKNNLFHIHFCFDSLSENIINKLAPVEHYTSFNAISGIGIAIGPRPNPWLLRNLKISLSIYRLSST